MTDDIPGSQADTLKRAPKGDRSINPLEPQYQYPGNRENINTANDPYGFKTCSMSQANFKTATSLGIKAVKESCGG